jgi:hypothetical protein
MFSRFYLLDIHEMRVLGYNEQDKSVPLLESLGDVDVFIHDSEHTYGTMMFEFKSVWPHLRRLGVLVSDDIEESRAFHDFARSVEMSQGPRRRPIGTK